MKIGMVTDSLGHLPAEKMLDAAAAMGVKGLSSMPAIGPQHRTWI
jgi:sugar phosphate isomerase/epimerase